jgi:ATP-dependent Lhr-like helicase
MAGWVVRARRGGPPGSEGRWSLQCAAAVDETERQTARAQQLLARHGVLTREAVAAEEMAFTSVYPVLQAMEEAGRVRRGYFTAGLGATQFAVPGAEDRLRDVREADEEAPQHGAAGGDGSRRTRTGRRWRGRMSRRPGSNGPRGRGWSCARGG